MWSKPMHLLGGDDLPFTPRSAQKARKAVEELEATEGDALSGLVGPGGVRRRKSEEEEEEEKPEDLARVEMEHARQKFADEYDLQDFLEVSELTCVCDGCVCDGCVCV